MVNGILQDRQQFVKIGSNYSKSVCIFAGSPQGTIAGPNNFKLLINDLKLETLCVKYVDDTTVSTTSADPTDASLQNCADDLMSWCRCNGMILNTEKTKEMVIYLGTKDICNSISPVVIEDKAIERVSCFKLLGVVLSSNLSWDAHVKYILTKVANVFTVFVILFVHALIHVTLLLYTVQLFVQFWSMRALFGIRVYQKSRKQI